MLLNSALLSLFSVGMAMPPITPRQSSGCASIPYYMSLGRIVGGQDASSMIPWQVSVRQGTSGNGHYCGATILDSKTILSAAHCFDKGQSMSGQYIMAGSTNRHSGGQIIEIQKGIWNSQAPYNSATQNNDAVILKLKSPLSFNSNVRPACLPSSNWSPLNAKCVVSGWGTLSSGGSLPTTLQWVDVPIISNSKCNQAYGSITNAMICAGYQQGGKDSCQGDSGGPLVCSDNGKAVITGVVSFGAGCADADYPGVYARVTTFLSWIKSNMESSNGYPSPSPAPSPSPSGCAKPSWSNDNYCDDENNNAACNYDGGACCNNQNSGWNSYCSSCQCLTPAPTPAPAPSPSACANPSWSNDKYCDDGNNNAACNYDGGACCNNQNSGWNSYCSSCQCLDPSYGAPAPAPAPSPSSCANPSWSNDKFCDDGNNNAACNYDGGACCNNQMSGWDSYCSQCQCLQYGRRTFEE